MPAIDAEMMKAAAPVIAALIALFGVASSILISRWQFKKSERRIERHFRNGDATKARLSVRQAELLRIKDEVALAADAVRKLVNTVINSEIDTEIIKSTAAAFQDVAPIFKTMSQVKSNWSVHVEEVTVLDSFEASLTEFFICLDFAPHPTERRTYQGKLNKHATQVEVTRINALKILKSSWEANSN